MEIRELLHCLPNLGSKVDCPRSQQDCYLDISFVKGTDLVWRPLQMCIYNIIIHLNDDHHWTREQVADWLEELDVDLDFI